MFSCETDHVFQELWTSTHHFRFAGGEIVHPQGMPRNFKNPDSSHGTRAIRGVSPFDKSTADWLLVAGSFWVIDGSWLINQANRAGLKLFVTVDFSHNIWLIVLLKRLVQIYKICVKL
jgi:hypothetical protein